MQHQSEYQNIIFDEKNHFLEIFWGKTDFSEQTYKDEVIWQLDFILRYKPKSLLIDTQKFFFTISPDVQDWSNREVLPKVLATDVKRIALLISSDLFAQVSIEQQMEDNPEALNLIRYFENYEQARRWCLE